MPSVDPSRGWWGQHCPARPADLSHAHDAYCDAPAHKDRCCECGVGPNDRAPMLISTPPPINVNDRLRALGLLPGEDERPVETRRDHETEAVAAAAVMRLPRRVKTKLVGLRNWYHAHPEDFA